LANNLWRKFISGFGVYDLVVIGFIAALGIAAKSVIGPLAHLVTVPIGIPGGALAGGFYMLWLVLARAFTAKRGAALLAALVQAIIVLITGSFGSHGALTLLTYTLPGLACELTMLPYNPDSDGKLLWCSLGGIAANLTGVVASNIAFFRLPALALALMAATAAFSGAAGGAAAYAATTRLKDVLGR
jgi:ABC-type thiamin/hydroxymethylpyrimidine transport system permease subunit